MQRLLIIRSASFQQIDTNILEIQKKFPSHEIHMLTHEHGKKLAEKYSIVKKVWIYPYKNSYTPSCRVIELKNEMFDVVIIPVTNITGAGFLNVYKFSFTISAKKRYVCNLVSEIKEITKRKIILNTVSHFIYTGLSYILTFIFAIITNMVLLINGIFTKKKTDKINTFIN